MDATHNTVYVETTIPSFYYTLRTDPESVARMHWTRQWWAAYADACHLTTSAAVIDELGKGTGERTEDRIALLANAVVLPINASKFHHIRMVNFELGLAAPILATPLNFGSLEGTSDE